jgi:DNA modification methylase
MPLKSHENILVFYKKRGTYNPQMEKGRPYSGFVTKNGATIGEVYGSAKSIHAANPGVRYPKSVLRFKQERGLHPTLKPTSLMEYLIATYSNEGDVVLDNCMGSGTTGVAAINLKRRFIGIERDPKYFATAKERLDPLAESGTTKSMDHDKEIRPVLNNLAEPGEKHNVAAKVIPFRATILPRRFPPDPATS